MKALVPIFAVLCSSALADLSAYHESPYVETSDEGQAHYTVIEQKCGSGCNECALLFISYDGIRMLEPSLSEKVFHDLFPQLKRGGDSGYTHFGVLFDRWDIPNNRLYLTVYGSQAPGHHPADMQRRVIYDLKTRKVAFAK
ncbi:MAG: hypothetical protein JO354_01615 [Verrucomicrobia bacterium]|nr:hypothetical protein [Verrucomicrobiota bacterium]